MVDTIFMAAQEVSASEADDKAFVTFRRTGDFTLPVTITYGVTDESTTSGLDYISPAFGTVVIPAGEDRVSILVDVNNDTLSESTEVFVVSLIGVDQGNIGTPRTTRVSILDDENPVQPPVDPPLVSDYNVTLQTISTGYFEPIKIEFSPVNPNVAVVVQKSGYMALIDIATGARLGTFMDISAQVNHASDRGVLDVAFHPDFPNNPYFYVVQTVDPPGAENNSGTTGLDGRANRFVHLVRYTVDASTNYTTIVPNSGVVLIGAAGQTFNDISGGGALNFSDPAYANLPSSERYIGPNQTPTTVIDGIKQDYWKIDSDSHVGGAIAFGADGMLYVSIGDGTSFDYADPRTPDVQNVNSLSGKVLRINPITGDGLTDNPFYTPGMSLDSNAAKVYQLGLRNPFTMGFDDDGRLFITETGWNAWEEINMGGPGANFGWPWFEGGDGGVLVRATGYRDFPQAAAFYAAQSSGQIAITPAFRAFAHDSSLPGYQVQAITGGDVIYDGNRYPISLRDNYFFFDVPEGELYAVDVNDRRELEFLLSAPGVMIVDMKQGPDGYVYYIDLGGGTANGGKVGRILISAPIVDPSILAPLGSAAATTNPTEFTLTSAALQVGAVMSNVRLDMRGNFSIAFDMNFGANLAGADGAAFLLHADPAGAAKLGAPGAYQGLATIVNGLGIAFDTYYNPTLGDLPNDFASFVDTDTLTRTSLVDLGNIEDGQYRAFAVTWNATSHTLTYFMNGVQLGQIIDANFVNTYLGGSNFAYFGFTGSTGGEFNVQSVRIGEVAATFEGETNIYPPVAVDDSYIGLLNTPFVVPGATLTANDTDLDNSSLVVTAVSGATHGTVALTNGQVTFTPAAGYVGLATFQYTVSDGVAADTGAVTIDVRATAPPVLDVNGAAARAPTGEYVITPGAIDQVGAAMSMARLDLRQNFSIAFDINLGTDPFGADGAAFVLHNNPAGASTLGYAGAYQGLGGIANGLGIAFDTYYNPTLGDIPNNFSSFIDTDTLARTNLVDLGSLEDGQYRSVVVSWNAATGVLSYAMNGSQLASLTAPTLAATYFGGSNFVYYGFTGSTGGLFNVQSVRLTGVAGTFEGAAANLPPVAIDDAFVAATNTPVTLPGAALVKNDTDGDGDTLVVSAVSNALNGTVSLTGGNVVFTPAAGFSGAASFDYTASDGKGGTDTGHVVLTVRPALTTGFVANGSAVAGANGAFTLNSAITQVGEVNSAQRIDVRQNFTITFDMFFGADPAGADGAAFVLHNAPAGAATLGAPGAYQGLANIANGLGIAFDTYYNPTLGDLPNDYSSFVDTDTLVRTGLVDLGEIEDGLYHTIVVNWNVATGVLSYSMNGVPLGSLTSATLGATYFGGSDFAYFGFTGATGGLFNPHAVRVINVAATYEGAPPANSPPVVVGESLAAVRDTALVVTSASLLANDSDPNGDPLTLTAVSNAVNGTVALAAGQVTFTPTTGFTGAASFQYTVSDGRGGLTNGTVAVAVQAPANTPPVATNDTAIAQRNTALAIPAATLLANDTDANGDTLTITGVSAPVNGTVSLAGTQITFTPTTGFVGAASFQYVISDGRGGTASAAVAVDVRAPTGAVPVAVADAYAMNEDATLGAASGRNVLTNDTDADTPRANLTAQLVAGPAHGVLTLNAAGTFSYAPTANYNGADTFTYRVSDGVNVSAPATVTITINPVNDTPVITYNGGAGTTLNVLEGQQIALAHVTATDADGTPITYTLTGNDAADFTIVNGVLRFAAAPNFEAPADAGVNNTYNVTVRAADPANAADTVNFTINVQNVAEATPLQGTAGADTNFRGAATADIMQANAGNDAVFGLAGNDVFVATLNDGNDTYTGAGGSDTLDMRAITVAATINLTTGAASSTQSGADTLATIENALGGSGADTITGSTAANRLSGGAGADVLTGGDGSDTFVFGPGFGADRITDFGNASGNQDMIDFSGFGFASSASVLSAAAQVGADTVITFTGGDVLTLTNFQLTALGADEFFF